MISFVDGYFGWLGNQMFQYAATKAQALRLGVPCHFPRNRPDLHGTFALSAVAFNIPVPKRWTEASFRYDPRINGIDDYTELSGYFQSEKYFAPYAEQIRQEFMFRAYAKENQSIPGHWPVRRTRQADEPEMVSVHVRRGDYLSFPEHHPPLTMDYYRDAMSQFEGARFLVFSDDPGWCLSNFGRENVEISTGRSAAEDMALMASCDHHIIANSSFSWWGAWLGRNPGKRVIAPRVWFGKAKELPFWDTSDLIPEGWERI